MFSDPFNVIKLYYKYEMLSSVCTAAEFMEPLCRKQVKSTQSNFPANATDFADIPL